MGVLRYGELNMPQIVNPLVSFHGISRLLSIPGGTIFSRKTSLLSLVLFQWHERGMSVKFTILWHGVRSIPLFLYFQFLIVTVA
jgi:hypothetical protein